MKRKRRYVAFGVAVLGVVLMFSPARMQDMHNDSKTGELAKPRIVIRKKARTLELYDGDRLIKTYTIVLGFAPDGDKEKEGDGKTPEGDFFVFTKNSQSKFHLSLGLSYPSTSDADRGLAEGSITRAERDAIAAAIGKNQMPPQKTALGGEIYIHGGGTDDDWTWGCVALKNNEIEELFGSVRTGTPVRIVP